MAVSDDETKIGIVLGRILIKDEQEITEIVIYKKAVPGDGSRKRKLIDSNKDEDDDKDKYVFEKLRKFEFKDACI